MQRRNADERLDVPARLARRLCRRRAAQSIAVAMAIIAGSSPASLSTRTRPSSRDTLIALALTSRPLGTSTMLSGRSTTTAERIIVFAIRQFFGFQNRKPEAKVKVENR